MVEKGSLKMDGLLTHTSLNILLLGSYDVLVGMKWLESHRAKVESYKKSFHCIDDEVNARTMQGTLRPISIRKNSAMQLKKNFIKGLMFAATVIKSSMAKEPQLKDYLILECEDVCLEKLPTLPPRREVVFQLS
jgi:hypothetical protein